MAERKVEVRLVVAGGDAFSRSMNSAATSTKQLGQAGEQASKSTDKTGDSFGKSAKKFIAGAVTILGVGKAMKDTAQLGMSFEQQMAQLGAVTEASGSQMDALGARARELGNSVDLPTASASDAAAAMLELAKGGLSVEESMAAAKGTLQLAAAAQIDGAQAAEIQSNAINTFALAGEDAGRVADVLANTANAASGEITDFAQGLAQTGLPAKALGISLEDTSTALGIFANNGMKGSDAGTSLKTMLISLTSPSKAQAAALKELGVSAFDAEGNFVGLETISGQLAAASARMTTEQYNAAAATAFGTDAVRAATAFAAAGSDGFNEMAEAVSRQGGAASLAEAQTQGLQGAIGLVKNVAEEAQLALFEGLSPTLQDLTGRISDMIPATAGALVPALITVGEAFVTVLDAVLPIVPVLITGLAPAVDGAANAVVGLTPILEIAAGVVGVFGSVMGALPSPISAAVVALGLMIAFRVPLVAMLTAAAKRTGFLALAFAGAGGLTGAVGRGMGALSRAATFMAGPWGLAIGVATIAIAAFAGGSSDAAAETAEFESEVKQLKDTFDEVTGAISDATFAAWIDEFAGFAGNFDQVNMSVGDFVNSLAAGARDGGESWRTLRSDIADAAVEVVDFAILSNNASSGVNKIAAGMGVGIKEVGQQLLAGGPEVQKYSDYLLTLGYTSDTAASLINEIVRSMEEQVPAARLAREETEQLSAAEDLFANEAKAAEEVANAKTVALGSMAVAAEDARTQGAETASMLRFFAADAESAATSADGMAESLTAISTSGNDARSAIDLLQGTLRTLETGQISVDDAADAAAASMREMASAGRDLATAQSDVNKAMEEGDAPAIAAANDALNVSYEARRTSVQDAARAHMDYNAALAVQEITTLGAEEAQKNLWIRTQESRVAILDGAAAARIATDDTEGWVDATGLAPGLVETMFKALVEGAIANAGRTYQVYDKARGIWTATFMTDKDAEARVKAGEVLQAYNPLDNTYTADLTANDFASDDANNVRLAVESIPLSRNVILTATQTVTQVVNTVAGSLTSFLGLGGQGYTGGRFTASGFVPGYAGGGMPFAGAPRPARLDMDNLIAMGSNGKPFAFRGDEWIINPTASKASGKLLQAINSGMLTDHMAGYSMGGTLNRTPVSAMTTTQPAPAAPRPVDVRVTVDLRGDGPLTSAMVSTAKTTVANAVREALNA